MSENSPNRVRRVTISVLVLLIIAVSIGVAVWQFSGKPSAAPAAAAPAAGPVEHRPAPPTVVTIQSYEGKYSFAGEPHITSIIRDTVRVLTNIGYVVGYDETKRDPLWVCYRLFKVNDLNAPPRPQKFEPDSRTTARSISHDYTGTGYDRGHMAPNFAIAVCYGNAAQLETFLMSNIIPQRPNLNRKVWMYLEQKEIREYAQAFKSIFVITGPIFDVSGARFSPGEIIPSACYKIMLETENNCIKMQAFIMPQTVEGNERLETFLTSVADIEKRTGLDFFPDLDADLQAKLEAQVPEQVW